MGTLDTKVQGSGHIVQALNKHVEVCCTIVTLSKITCVHNWRHSILQDGLALPSAPWQQPAKTSLATSTSFLAYYSVKVKITL